MQKSLNKSKALPALTRAGLTHLYLVCIHPYEDGNGRIARALTEKVLAQAGDAPSLIALSQTIEAHRTDYYTALEDNNKELEVSGWLEYLSETILDAQKYSEQLLDFIIAKTRMLDRLKPFRINTRVLWDLKLLEEAFDFLSSRRFTPLPALNFWIVRGRGNGQFWKT